MKGVARMVKIRNGMFETNSSSTHTIIVTEQKTEPGAIVDFRMGEFGWECGKLDTVDEKASYLYTMACELYGRDVYQDLYEVLSKYGVQCSCTLPYHEDKYGFGNGYVDHASCGAQFVMDMMNHDKALIKYLFSDDSFVVTGNDNMDLCDNKYYDAVEKVHYRHKTYYKGN